MFNTFEKLPYDYVWWFCSGGILTNAETDLYNQYSADIKRTKGDERKALLDRRHKFLVDCLVQEV